MSMSGHWLRSDSDWLVSYYKELTKSLDDFVILVAQPPLILEEANQVLVFITAHLVRFIHYFLEMLAHFSDLHILQEQVFKRIGPDSASPFTSLAHCAVDYCHYFCVHDDTYQYPVYYQSLASMVRVWKALESDEAWDADVDQVRSQFSSPFLRTQSLFLQAIAHEKAQLMFTQDIVFGTDF